MLVLVIVLLDILASISEWNPIVDVSHAYFHVLVVLILRLHVHPVGVTITLILIYYIRINVLRNVLLQLINLIIIVFLVNLHVYNAYPPISV